MQIDVKIKEDLLRRKIAILSGGSDVTGNPLITFPVLPTQEQQKWILQDIETVLRYYAEVVRLILRRAGLAFLANLQHGYCEEFLTILVKSLQTIETERRGTVTVFYVLKPKSKTKYSLLKKLLGLKRKKGEVTFINQFRVVLLKNIAELHHQVATSQLTIDFGGQLPYDHGAWMAFHTTVLSSLSQFEEMIDRLHDVRDRALLLQDYETTDQSANQLRDLKLELEQRFKSLISESGVTVGVDNCKQTLHLLDHASEEEPLCNLHQTLMMKVVTNVRKTYEEFTDIQNELQAIWKSVEESLQSQIGLKERKDEANELCMIITERFWPNMMEHPKIASSLSQAEINRTHFLTSLYEPAKELLNSATHILEDLQTIRITRQHDKTGIQDIVYRLSNTIHPLAAQLNDLNQTYASVHVFYATFEKTFSWYEEALNFIPNTLCSRAVNNRNRSACLPAPTGWRESVRKFLQKNPVPHEDHITDLNTYVHPAIDKSTKTQSRLLSNRIRVLSNIFFNTHLDVTTLCNIHAWKQEKNSEFDGDTLNSAMKDKYNESKFENGPGRRKPANTRLKRKIHKSRTYRETDPSRDGINHPEKGNTDKYSRTLSRSSSTDTEHLIRERKFSERFVCLASPENEDGNFGTARSLEDIHNGYRRKYSMDSMSINSVDPDTDYDESNNIVNCIQNVTSDWSISSDRKLQYVSDLLISAESNNLKPDKEIDEMNRVSHSPSKHISELNKRLTRSLGNMISMENEFEPDTPHIESVSTGDLLDLNDKESVDFDNPECIFAFPNSYLNHTHQLHFPFEDDDEDDTAPETSETTDFKKSVYHASAKQNNMSSQPAETLSNGHNSHEPLLQSLSNGHDSHISLLESQRALEASLRRTDLLLKKIQMSSRLRERSRLRRLVSRGESLRVTLQSENRPVVSKISSFGRRNSNISSKRSVASLSTDYGYVSSVDHGRFRKFTYLNDKNKDKHENPANGSICESDFYENENTIQDGISKEEELENENIDTMSTGDNFYGRRDSYLSEGSVSAV